MSRNNRTFNNPKLNQMKYEIAAGFGISNYAEVDKGNLPSRVNGSIGGMITKTLVAQALGETPTKDFSLSWKEGQGQGGSTGSSIGMMGSGFTGV
jgi:hypothetical protein